MGNNTVSDLIADIENYYKTIDVSMRRALAKDAKANDRCVSCPSCTTPHCCYQKLVVSLWEVMPAARWLISQKLATIGLRASLLDIGTKMEAVSNVAWFEDRQPCLFLEEDRCSIYPHRPVECRTQFVISPPEDCGAPKGKLVQVVDDKPILAQTIVFGTNVHKVLGLKENKMRMLMGTFPRLLAIMLEIMIDNAVDHRKFIRRLKWPSTRAIEEGWFDGKNPFSDRT